MQQEWSANVVRELWPLGFSIRVLLYGGQSDLIGGEFWAEGNLGSIECRAASSAAHIYGKKQVSAESYTASGKPFLRYPGELKLSLIHISEPTRRTPISYAVFC